MVNVKQNPFKKESSHDATQRLISAKSRKWYRDLRFGDFLLYAFILTVAGLVLLQTGSMINQQVMAVLSQDGEPMMTVSMLDLEAGGSEEITSRGYHYTIDYRDGRIRFAKADCPDQICVHTGWISRSGQLSACVPGHLVLRMESEGDPDAQDLDVIIR